MAQPHPVKPLDVARNEMTHRTLRLVTARGCINPGEVRAESSDFKALYGYFRRNRSRDDRYW